MERVLRAAADRARDFCRASEAAASASRAGSPQRPRGAGGSPDGRLGALVAEGESAYASMPPAGKVAAIAAKFAGAAPGASAQAAAPPGGARRCTHLWNARVAALSLAMFHSNRTPHGMRV